MPYAALVLTRKTQLDLSDQWATAEFAAARAVQLYGLEAHKHESISL
ncbi:MAG: hypothetical protein SF162_05605 [bacterium]|nr:hypothetical protein [bacterium]